MKGQTLLFDGILAVLIVLLVGVYVHQIKIYSNQEIFDQRRLSDLVVYLMKHEDLLNEPADIKEMLKPLVSEEGIKGIEIVIGEEEVFVGEKSSRPISTHCIIFQNSTFKLTKVTIW
jgi:hypothetical protein